MFSIGMVKIRLRPTLGYKKQKCELCVQIICSDGQNSNSGPHQHLKISTRPDHDQCRSTWTGSISGPIDQYFFVRVSSLCFFKPSSHRYDRMTQNRKCVHVELKPKKWQSCFLFPVEEEDLFNKELQRARRFSVELALLQVTKLMTILQPNEISWRGEAPTEVRNIVSVTFSKRKHFLSSPANKHQQCHFFAFRSSNLRFCEIEALMIN